jgi:hypothetical protein
MSGLIKSRLLQLFRIKKKYVACKITDNDFIIDFIIDLNKNGPLV